MTSSRKRTAEPVATPVDIKEYNSVGVGSNNPVDVAEQPAITTYPSTVADGANVALGAVADAAVSTDAAGTVSAKLRGIVKLLVAQITVKLAAGVALIGKVGIDQTTPGTTNRVDIGAALPAGTNLLGKVGIDQTTPGTTNRVDARITDGTTYEKLPTSTFATNGGSGLSAIAASAGNKHRIYSLTISADTAGTITISDGFAAIYLPATLVPVTIDFGRLGRLQNTANTAITITNSGAGNVSAHGTYSTEA